MPWCTPASRSSTAPGEGGGWRALGHDAATSRADHAATRAGRDVGHEHLRVGVDDHSRLAHVEVLPDEQSITAAASWARAAAWPGEHRVTARRS